MGLILCSVFLVVIKLEIPFGGNVHISLVILGAEWQFSEWQAPYRSIYFESLFNYFYIFRSDVSVL